MNVYEFKNILENKILTKTLGLKSYYTKNNYEKIKKELPDWFDYLIKNTTHLNTNNINQKIYHLYNDIKEIPKCKICGKELKYLGFKFPYRETCSAKCGIANRNTNSKLISESVRKKLNEKLIGLNEWLANPHEVNITKYTIMEISTLSKIMKDKDNCFYLLWKTKDLIPLPKQIAEIKELQLFRRQYHLLNDIKEIPKCKICGEEANYYNSVKGYSDTCKSLQCEIERNRIARRITTHNKLNDNLEGYTVIGEYKDRYTPIMIKHDECGHEFYYNCWNGSHVSNQYLCPICYCSNKQENEIYDYLISILPDTKIIQNDRTILDGLELDFYLPEYNLAIEFNGMYWHSETSGKNKNYHLNKTNNCEKQNIQLLHIFSYEWNCKRNIVESIIAAKLRIFKCKLYGRCCVVKEINNDIKNKFLNENHIQGEDKSKYKLGLFHEDELVSVMTFGKRSLGKGKSKLELMRFCNKLNTTIIGGANKLFQYFIKNYEIKEEIISYCDRRYSKGGFYERLGFVFSHISNPNYYYFKNDFELISRNKMMKHKMINILDEFDETLSESQNARNNKFHRIWNCGNYVYKYHK